MAQTTRVAIDHCMHTPWFIKISVDAVVFRQTLGQVGVVTKLTVLGHLQVRVNGRRWVYDRRCLIRVTTDLLPQNYGIIMNIGGWVCG